MMRPLTALVSALVALALPAGPAFAQDTADPLRIIAVDVEGARRRFTSRLKGIRC